MGRRNQIYLDRRLPSLRSGERSPGHLGVEGVELGEQSHDHDDGEELLKRDPLPGGVLLIALVS
jgi:hypothetical protein